VQASAEAAPAPAAAATATTAAAPAATAPAVVEEPARSPDEAYIETARCSTCNECTQLNGKMFAYDANQQAYIADINAGTYADLVQAAENCQVAIIHPGKPRNPDEPGLEALLERAQPFL
jgi:ferredoxin